MAHSTHHTDTANESTPTPNPQTSSTSRIPS